MLMRDRTLCLEQIVLENYVLSMTVNIVIFETDYLTLNTRITPVMQPEISLLVYPQCHAGLLIFMTYPERTLIINA